MRAYYSKANKEERPDLMVKKLRYYARFIVVCLLLKKMKLVRDLVRELAKQIEDYTQIYEPEDQLEWSLVLGEIKAFIEADVPVNVVDVDSSPIVLSHRLTPLNTPPMEQGSSVYLTLQEILIVGNCYEQVKFSELTLDMFRMLQTLEREPQEDLSNQLYDQSPAPGNKPGFENGDKINKRDNPHKYLLYKPTFSQLYTFLASGFKELPPGGAMLVYVSADGSLGNMKETEDVAFDFGGVVTNNKREGDAFNNRTKRPAHIKEMHCLHPGDVYPFTRKPLFLIIDSDNSTAFQNFPNLFGQPMACLLSPENVPATMQDQHQKGNLFTMFLHSPLMGFCYVCSIVDIPIALWDKCQGHIEKFMAEASKVFSRSRSLDHAFMQFYGDDFLRLLMLRFIFCWITLRLHRGFKGPSYYPTTQPPLPEDEILHQASLHRLVMDVASTLEVRGLFGDLTEVD
ncbi:protein SCAI [Lingula anatina]|uniref:Protein SCAI n=1 Tax=Lingula anatina TaxID=7574 RepID=A0A1S3J1R0_LINAN|nr:protein SCAI [Lingula anatina]|eukprot:XP_013404360.1 protein SCAI [Lingula anatina]